MTMLFEKKEFISAAGIKLRWKIDCDAFTDKDLTEIAKICAPKLPHYRNVVGVPRGGLRIAEAFRAFCSDSTTTLVVDDVWTTGMSWARFVTQKGLNPGQCVGFVLFSRAMRKLPTGIYSFWKDGFKGG